MSEISVLDHKESGESAETIQIYSHGCDTVVDLKKQIQQLLNLPIDKQVLCCGGVEMLDSEKIVDYHFNCMGFVLLELFRRA